MSFKLMRLVQERRIGPGARASAGVRKAVLTAIADRANDDGANIWTSQATLALQTECAVRSVRQCLAEFESEGLIKRSGGNRGRAVLWRIEVPRLEALPPLDHGATRRPTPAPRAGVTPAPRADARTDTPAPRAGAPAPRAYNPILNPTQIVRANARTNRARENATKKRAEEGQAKATEARRLVGEVTMAMSASGREHTKPNECAKLLPPLIEQHGYEAVRLAGEKFYASYTGDHQPGLNAIADDGRLEALIQSPLEAAESRARWVWLYATGSLSEWDTRRGQAPSPAEIEESRAGPRPILKKGAGKA